MFNAQKKRQSKPSPKTQKVSFDKAFEERIGRDPATYISEKIAAGSDVESVRYLFDIVAAEIELRNRCKSPGFDYYYKQLLSEQIQKPDEAMSVKPQITKTFIISQLIGKERFIDQYTPLLKALAENKEFFKFVYTLRQELDGKEIVNPRTENKRIADYFYSNKANERFPEVKGIVESVLSYGRQSSAYISIYYAMYLFQK